MIQTQLQVLIQTQIQVMTQTQIQIIIQTQIQVLIQTQLQVMIKTQIQLQMCWLNPWIPCTWLVPLLHFHNRKNIQKQGWLLTTNTNTTPDVLSDPKITLPLIKEYKIKLQTHTNIKGIFWHILHIFLYKFFSSTGGCKFAGGVLRRRGKVIELLLHNNSNLRFYQWTILILS